MDRPTIPPEHLQEASEHLSTIRDFIRFGVSALRQYGEIQVDDPDNLRVVYSMAGHVLRTWMRCAGAKGVPVLLEAVRTGEDFEVVFTRLGRDCLASIPYP